MNPLKIPYLIIKTNNFQIPHVSSLPNKSHNNTTKKIQNQNDINYANTNKFFKEICVRRSSQFACSQ